MNPQPYNTQNPILGDSFLSSKYFSPDFIFTQGVEFFQRAYHFLFIKGVIYDFLSVFSVFFIIMIVYCSVRLLEIRAKEKRHLEHELAEYAHHQAERDRKAREAGEVSQNEQWRKVLNYTFSINHADWKLAVIEADVMLDILMDQLGFKAENLGEKLKLANQENFRNLTAAWEVHTIRNRIAHEGSSFELSQHETKRVIALYEQIFREFGYI